MQGAAWYLSEGAELTKSNAPGNIAEAAPDFPCDSSVGGAATGWRAVFR
jgi:hypothetical protein